MLGKGRPFFLEFINSKCLPACPHVSLISSGSCLTSSALAEVSAAAEGEGECHTLVGAEGGASHAEQEECGVGDRVAEEGCVGKAVGSLAEAAAAAAAAARPAMWGEIEARVNASTQLIEVHAHAHTTHPDTQQHHHQKQHSLQQ